MRRRSSRRWRKACELANWARAGTWTPYPVPTWWLNQDPWRMDRLMTLYYVRYFKEANARFAL